MRQQAASSNRAANDHQDMCAFPIVGALHGCRGAQTVPEPIVNGHPPQPSQQLIDGRERVGTRARDRSDQLEIDRLYDELLRASSPGGRQPPPKQLEGGEIR
jgi:hypothetical protein